MLKNDFVVLGAGTSGLIISLMLREKYPDSSIVIIKSGDVGIVGVGEGSTEHWSSFMSFVGIDNVELIKKTKATVKIGILFENWSKDGLYVHSIDPLARISGLGRPETFNNALLRHAHKKFPLSLMFEEIFYKNNVPVQPGLSCSNQYHFDTFELNNFLTQKCLEKSITIEDALVVDVVISNNGDVESLLTDKGTVSGSFFIDCSGFKRIIASKVGSKWVSKSEYLPMNRAITLPSPHDQNYIEPYTKATAKSAGWIWRIPTQERYGNGYVFCDKFISSEEALRELNQHLGTNAEAPVKDIKFEAGRVDKFWINNVVCIGLAGSFAEPLEAQSIGFTIIQSFALLSFLDGWNINRNNSEIYNLKMAASFDNVVDYLQLHYLGNKDESKFWKEKPFTLTDFNKNNIEQVKKGIFDSFNNFDNSNMMFGLFNWYQVVAGLNLIDTHYLASTLSKNRPLYNDISIREIIDYRNKVKNSIVMDHKKYLNLVNFNYEFREKYET